MNEGKCEYCGLDVADDLLDENGKCIYCKGPPRSYSDPPDPCEPTNRRRSDITGFYPIPDKADE